jgi:hypothetical protein
MRIETNDFDYFEVPPAFIEVDLQDIDENFAKIRQELFLNGDCRYTDHQKIIQEILIRGADIFLNELSMARKKSAPF